jgi:hypothetical protein
MLKAVLSISVFICVSSAACAQARDSFLARIDTLKRVLDRADTLNPFDDRHENIFDTITAVNNEIAERLASILSSRDILKYEPDSLLDFSSLGKVHSKDKRLWIFSWYENTGGSWKSNLSLVHYRTRLNEPRTDYQPVGKEDGAADDSWSGGLSSNGAWFDTIYKLKAKGKDLYLCLGSGISCNTCIYRLAIVVELTHDGIDFNYPAFPSKKDGTGDREDLSSLTVEARMDDFEKFSFDPRTQTLTIVYQTDDLTPVRTKKPERVIRRFVFNGIEFRNGR